MKEKDKGKEISKEKQKPDNTPKINKAALGATATEAWADAEKVDKKTKMNFPSEEAVANAKEWVEENEK